ncbi:hypothetical protein OB236_37485 [Paenibacillus sp. WQ 127069]|uniref:Uncharacterized protein n=1 Tax=Paenibacillus baimaensis TaxID=2982185 RepID=A0ABT2UUY0_9BACL|nr:hypothetical protein [Paenibacillus sp. WQ 127069]MCU6797831.1 hypothetical protein [Paenibacillus sp. WQ 127069]
MKGTGSRSMLGLLLGSMLILTTSVTVYAHLTGAFADFLVTVQDEQTTEKLKTEIRSTKAEIESLVPRVNKLENDYKDKQQLAVSQLQFYNEVGLDTWMNLLLQSESLVDAMGSHWLFENHLQAYMKQLDLLYKDYMQLQSTKVALEGHQRLLTIIEDNMQMRNLFLSQNAQLPIDQVANYLDIDWQSEVEKHLIQALKHDTELTEQQVQTWATAAAENASYRLNESWLNAQSDVEYFFRSDHVYVVYKKKDIHVILIGQVLSGGNGYAQLQFEAGFFNGFLMPDTLMIELSGFRIRHDLLEQLPGMKGPVDLRQSGGALIVTSEAR